MQVLEKPSEDLLPSTIETFWGSIPPVWNFIKSNIRGIAVEHYAISVEQFHILRHIRRGVTSVSELAQVKGISRSAVSQAVDLLVERGLICRLQNQRDRRNIPLELTAAGDKLLDAIWEKNRTWMSLQMNTLTASELDLLSRAFELLARTFHQPLDQG